VTQTDLMNAIHFGAQNIVVGDDDEVMNESIDDILGKSKAKTKDFEDELNKIE